MGIINSYTMESSFGGSTLGKRGKGKPGSGKQEKDFLTGLSTPNAAGSPNLIFLVPRS